MRAGRVVVANVSRGVIHELTERYGRLVVIQVTAAEGIRAQRLRDRRREPESVIGQRLAALNRPPATASAR
jgi:ribose 1,5-bisphosphokinase